MVTDQEVDLVPEEIQLLEVDMEVVQYHYYGEQEIVLHLKLAEEDLR